MNPYAESMTSKNTGIISWKGAFRAVSLLLMAMLMTACYAEPTESDIERTRKTFLRMRMENALKGQAQSVSDKELFEQSCVRNRVQCYQVMEMMKESDPDFYRTLTGESMKENDRKKTGQEK